MTGAKFVIGGLVTTFPLVLAQVGEMSAKGIGEKLVEYGALGIFCAVLALAARALYNDNKKIVAAHEKSLQEREDKLLTVLASQTEATLKQAIASTGVGDAIHTANLLSIEVKDALHDVAKAMASCERIQTAAINKIARGGDA